MKTAIGLILIVCGIAVGLYVGLYLCLYGGVIQIIHSATLSTVDAAGVALGIIRVLLTGVAGWASAFVLVLPGVGLLSID